MIPPFPCNKYHTCIHGRAHSLMHHGRERAKQTYRPARKPAGGQQHQRQEQEVEGGTPHIVDIVAFRGEIFLPGKHCPDAACGKNHCEIMALPSEAEGQAHHGCEHERESHGMKQRAEERREQTEGEGKHIGKATVDGHIMPGECLRQKVATVEARPCAVEKLCLVTFLHGEAGIREVIGPPGTRGYVAMHPHPCHKP